MSYDRSASTTPAAYTTRTCPTGTARPSGCARPSMSIFHRAFDRVLDCEHTLLTEEGMLGRALEIRFGRARSTVSSC
jgi:hypothetical protein